MSKAATTNQNPTKEDTMNPAAAAATTTTTTNQDPATTIFGIERLMGLKEWARDHGMSATLEDEPGS